MRMKVTITDKNGRHRSFEFDAASAALAAQEVAADSDYEPDETVEIEVDDGELVRQYAVETRPTYRPRLQVTSPSPGRLH